jgi:4-diphosphocytidyl-2-C-methyl-D-erythritol kinase
VRTDGVPITTVTTPAKLNLILKVVGRRADGYHDLVSLMVPVNLTDTLTFSPGPRGIALSCRPDVLPKRQGNLVFRAASTFYARIEKKPFLSISLTKQIPVAAGLGGGSSDAAATLKALNRREGNPLDRETLAETALTLGADVPFFLQNLPAIARGVGEQLEPVTPWPGYWYVIVTPPLSVSTAWVYGNLKLELTTPENSSIVNPLRRDWTRIGDLLENDLETVTAARYPIIGYIKSLLLKAGAEGALMSGSGPSVFGVFRSEEAANSAKMALSSRVEGTVFALQDFRDSPPEP